MRPVRLLGGAAGDEPAAQRIVATLVVAVFVQGVGASAVLPLLPLYLRAHGTSDSLVGAVMGSFFVAGVATQYAAGHLTDRLGNRRVISGGLTLYAIASLGFMTSVGAGGYIALRSLQGVGSGAVQVASLALVGRVVPLGRRGRAFSYVFGAQLAGMAVGPLSGSVAGLAHLQWLFLVTAGLSLLAIVPVTLGAQAHVVAESPPETRAPLVITQALVGVAIIAVSAGLITGVYETCWSLLMRSRGAAAWQIGLSWTCFAIPFAVFSPTAGRLVDRLDRRWLAVFATAASCGFAATYPFIPVVAVLMAMGVLEAIGVAVAFPAAQSLLTQVVSADTQGRAQGFFTTAETAAIALGAAVSGALFGAWRPLPFLAGAILGVLVLVPLPRFWRGVPGRVSEVTDVASPGGAEAVAAGATSTS